MAKGRASKGFLFEPAKAPNYSAAQRQSWLESAKGGFIGSAANRTIYGWLLERIWPPDHGIPGPIVTQNQLREHVDTERRKIQKGPYKDVFRRVRELQGEEGFTCIVKEGTKYQLQSLEVRPKRAPRANAEPDGWQDFKGRTGNRCAVCSRQEPEIQLSPDHRVPRSRYAGPPEAINALENLQPLCEQCNNTKSTQCRGCHQNCQICPWAFPETYRPIQINDDNREQLRRSAEAERVTAEELANRILQTHFNNRRR